MKLKVTVNGVAYDIEVEVEEQERRPALGSITIGGGGGAAAAPTTAHAPRIENCFVAFMVCPSPWIAAPCQMNVVRSSPS